MTHTVEESRAATTVRAGINEKKFFAKMAHMFHGSWSVIGEVLQNARRAHATRIDVVFRPEDKCLSFQDDGVGIGDFANLVQLCDSGWDEATELSDKPYGMGVFSLFHACAAVTFRSNGLRLTLTLDDIVSKRAVALQADPQPVTRGTIVEMADLKDQLVAKANQYWSPSSGQQPLGALSAYEMVRAILDRVAGFPVPVWLNGEPCPRPYAQEFLRGNVCSIGFVSIAGVHGKSSSRLHGTHPIRSDLLSESVVYLQGLPVGGIGGRRWLDPEPTVVHLDSTQFAAQMPDRAYLFDERDAKAKIEGVLKEVVKQHLIEQKAALDGKEFVQRHWGNCRRFGCSNLLNDIPWVPRGIFEQVVRVCQDSEQVMERWGGWDDPHGKLIARGEIAAERHKFWRDAPELPTDFAFASVLLKIMQREKILRLRRDPPEGHWLHELLPSTSDFTVAVEPRNPRGDNSVYVSDAFESCQATLVDSILVEIASEVDPTLRLRYEIDDDWILTPLDPEEEACDDTFDANCAAMVAYVCVNDASHDHPVDALGDYRDEDGRYDEPWRDRIAREFDSYLAALRGVKVAAAVRQAIAESSVPATLEQRLDLAIVRTTVRQYRSDSPHIATFDVVDAETEAFWDEFAAAFEAQTDAPDVKSRLRAALATVVKPGEFIGPEPVDQPSA